MKRHRLIFLFILIIIFSINGCKDKQTSFVIFNGSNSYKDYYKSKLYEIDYYRFKKDIDNSSDLVFEYILDSTNNLMNETVTIYQTIGESKILGYKDNNINLIWPKINITQYHLDLKNEKLKIIGFYDSNGKGLIEKDSIINNYLIFKDYMIDGKNYRIYCFGFFVYGKDGDYIKIISQDYGLIADFTLDWGLSIINLDNKNKNMQKLFKIWRQDKSFFPFPKKLLEDRKNVEKIQNFR